MVTSFFFLSGSEFWIIFGYAMCLLGGRRILDLQWGCPTFSAMNKSPHCWWGSKFGIIFRGIYNASEWSKLQQDNHVLCIEAALGLLFIDSITGNT